MGAHSTIMVSEERARNLMSMFAQVATKEDLSSLMGIMLYDRLYNCMIDECGENDELATDCLTRYLDELEQRKPE